MEYLVRPVREADAEPYRDLRIEALRTAPTAFGMDVTTAENRSLEQWQQQMRDGTGDSQTLNCIAEAGSECVGMIVFQQETGVKTAHNGNIYGVYVRPAWRGVGILDALFAAGSAWAAPRGVRFLKLSVSATNVAAIRAYTRLGFQVYGVDPEAIVWEGRFYDELLMYKRLSS